MTDLVQPYEGVEVRCIERDIHMLTVHLLGSRSMSPLVFGDRWCRMWLFWPSVSTIAALVCSYMLTFFLTDPRATLVHIQAMGFTQPWVVVMSPGCQGKERCSYGLLSPAEPGLL